MNFFMPVILKHPNLKIGEYKFLCETKKQTTAFCVPQVRTYEGLEIITSVGRHRLLIKALSS